MDAKQKYLRAPVSDETHAQSKSAAALAHQTIEQWVRETIENRLLREAGSNVV